MSDEPVVEERELTEEEKSLTAAAFAEGCEYGYNMYAEDLVRCFRRLAKAVSQTAQGEDAARIFEALAQAIEDDELIEEQDTEDGPRDVSELTPDLDLN